MISKIYLFGGIVLLHIYIQEYLINTKIILQFGKELQTDANPQFY